MWIVLGLLTIIFTYLNVKMALSHKEVKWYGFISLSLTALTTCSFYSQSADWVIKEDLSALMDVVPTMSIYLWIFIIISILINGFAFIYHK